MISVSDHETLPVASIHPDDHKCGRPGEVSHEQATSPDPLIWCRVCGRIWDLTERGWKPDPRPPLSQKDIAAINKRRRGR